MKTHITGVAEGVEPFLLKYFKEAGETGLLYVASTDQKAKQLQDQLAVVCPDLPTFFFPAWDCLPYDRLSPSMDIVSQRVHVLTELLEYSAKSLCLITSVAAFSQKLPPASSFKGSLQKIRVGDHLNREVLVQFLSRKGYVRSETVREQGEYAVRGGLIDLFPTGVSLPVRIDFFGDEIDSLRQFDPLTQTSLESIPEISLKPVSEVSLTPAVITSFRTKYRELFGASGDTLYQSISEGRRYGGMEHWLPLFFDQCDTLLDYISPNKVIFDSEVQAAFKARCDTIRDYYLARLQKIPGDKSALFHPLPPEYLYLTEDAFQEIFNSSQSVHITSFSQEPYLDFQARPLTEFSSAFLQGKNPFDHFQTLWQGYVSRGKQVILACFSEGSLDRFITVLKEHKLTSIKTHQTWPFEKNTHINLVLYPLEKGFETPDMLVVTEQDLLGERLARRAIKKRRIDKFFLDTSGLNEGDLVVHREHGIGRYDGLETVQVAQDYHDCLRLLYEGGDKLYLPVENMDVLSRYGSDEATAQLDRLGSSAWQHRKAKVKKRIHEVADYLIKLAAERSLHKGVVFDDVLAEYQEFCARFPYPETDDQLKAIEEVFGDMASGRPMDRLICGDVGFGKTEVALRAAYLAASHGKQVAVVVPTTLLCRQHFETFSRRFQGFPYRVAQLSRFVSSKQADQIRRELAEGNVQIIIATHALFSEKITFADLGLLIVDEEQHFGVKQKEKLKQLKSDVHVLTLTATPIPRTLQLALTGVREMSLITTPPIDRLAVRTFVMPYDPVVLREAILREHYRGGQTFYVSPRLEDLAKLQEQLKELIPEVKIIMAHGQMPSAQLEHVMDAFYNREYDVLLSTNIVESGIDIATANTLIIHRADLFGLAQLYQLRGRVGRSKTQGYAYLTLPENQVLSTNSKKRLEIMQTLDTLGAGFTLASHDMDIRGTGNIIGEEQSGHIREVGVELYQNLLQEAILRLRTEQEIGNALDREWTPQINVGASILIPESYVSDLSLRLSLYRRLASLENRVEIDGFAAELVDRFGKFPAEVSNLLDVIEIKINCKKAGIEKLDVGPKGAVVTFWNNTFAKPDKLLAYLQKLNGIGKIRPDQKIVFSQNYDSYTRRMHGAKKISEVLAKIAS